MKLKYYLRGLGIGIIVTVILMSISSPKKQETTSQNTELVDVVATVIEETEAVESFITEEEETKTEELMIEETVPVESETEESSILPESETESEEPFSTFLIQVASGDDVWTTAEKLYDANLIEDASEFVSYLKKNSYDTKMKAGVKEIPQGASLEEIAKILISY